VRSFENIVERENPNLQDQSEIIADAVYTSVDYFRFRLQETEELNVHLEKLIEQRTQELKEMVETHNKFMSIVAHDLRSPLSSIVTSLELLKKKMDYYKIIDIDIYINIVTSSANKAFNLLDSLLAWSASQREERNINPVKVALCQLVEDEIDNVYVLANQKQIEIINFIAIDLYVSADIQMVKTILRNLINNAVKYTNNGGCITINALKIGKMVEVIIKDTGVGITQESINKLFKPDNFYSTSGTNNEQGSGLGLLLCNEFVKMHGGAIHIDSEPNKGSEFKFTLPHYI
jgi:signal transduction histidine kinase